jgi:hypothetical protein
MKKLLTITSKGEGYTADVILDDGGSVFFVGDADIDVDGSPNWERDPDASADTSLHYNGKPINADKVSFIVLPPECIKAVAGVVLGCKATAKYHGRECAAVVADVGPHRKLGEMSSACARMLGINPSPTSGGVDEQCVTYRYWPGIPALVDGVLYKLQPYGS